MPSEWAMMIKQEIIDIKIRLTALESKLENIAGKPLEDIKAGVPSEGIGPEVAGRAYTPTVAEELVEATYTIRQASMAMRGYLMLLDEAGLNKDQKKMVKELEEAMMMMMKLMTTIRMLQLAYQALTAAELGPMGFVYLAFAGGTFSASLAYGSKLTGGMV
jgi:hypothetical protein